ncbi:MAG TPA: hypothetical protein VEY94_10835 [Patescibacteria group bacterium]|nr:hypothetical protein [Patescibacteria group bacterium]
MSEIVKVVAPTGAAFVEWPLVSDQAQLHAVKQTIGDQARASMSGNATAFFNANWDDTAKQWSLVDRVADQNW